MVEENIPPDDELSHILVHPINGFRGMVVLDYIGWLDRNSGRVWSASKSQSDPAARNRVARLAQTIPQGPNMIKISGEKWKEAARHKQVVNCEANRRAPLLVQELLRALQVSSVSEPWMA